MDCGIGYFLIQCAQWLKQSLERNLLQFIQGPKQTHHQKSQVWDSSLRVHTPSISSAIVVFRSPDCSASEQEAWLSYCKVHFVGYTSKLFYVQIFLLYISSWLSPHCWPPVPSWPYSVPLIISSNAFSLTLTGTLLIEGLAINKLPGLSEDDIVLSPWTVCRTQGWSLSHCFPLIICFGCWLGELFQMKIFINTKGTCICASGPHLGLWRKLGQVLGWRQGRHMPPAQHWTQWVHRMGQGSGDPAQSYCVSGLKSVEDMRLVIMKANHRKNLSPALVKTVRKSNLRGIGWLQSILWARKWVLTFRSWPTALKGWHRG